MTAPTWLVDLLAEHILLGYGFCSCGAVFAERGSYSRDHRVHLADVIAAELRARLGRVGDLGVREQWPPDEWRAALAAVTDELLGGSDAD